jgi:transcription elongation factor S-II
MTTLDLNIYETMKSKLFELFEEDTLERIMEGLVNFLNNYIEINDCSFLINDIFIDKVNSIIINMNESDYLANMITQGYITPEELCYLKPHELCPDKYKHIIEKKAYEHKQKKNKGSNIFSCKKCKQSNCEVTQKQTRSADEPATTFVKCLECDFCFKF